MKQKLALLLALAMLCVVFAGCSGGASSSSSASTGGSSSSSTSTASSASDTSSQPDTDPVSVSGEFPDFSYVDGIDTSEFVTVDWLMVGDVPDNGQTDAVLEKINEILRRELNCELRLSFIGWTEYLSNYNLRLASGEALDIVYCADWLDAKMNASRGAYLPLDDLLPVYAPNFWNDVKPEEWDQARDAEGHIFQLPMNNHAFYGLSAMFYRNDWAKEAGFTDGIHSFDDMGKYWQWVVDNHSDVVPWNTAGDLDSNQLLNMYMFDKTDCINCIGSGSFNIILGESNDNPYQLLNAVEQDWFLDFAKTMKEWGDAGYWPSDVMSRTGNQTDANMFQVGKSASWEHQLEQLFNDAVEYEKKVPGSDPQAYVYEENRGFSYAAAATRWADALAATCDCPERALMVYDRMRYDRELYNLYYYGIEGIQYELNSEGLRVDPEGYSAAKDGIYFCNNALRNDEYDIERADAWPYKKKYIDMIKPMLIISPYAGFSFDPTPVTAEYTAMNEIVARYLPSIMFGKAGDPEAAVKEFRDALQSVGIDRVIEEATRQLNEFAAG